MLELLILAALGGWLFLALRSCRRKGGGCGGSCAGCSGSLCSMEGGSSDRKGEPEKGRREP